MGTLHGVSPARVSPLGGVVLLLHGFALPFRQVYHGEATILVGNATCPFRHHRSDPKGTFLACGPLPRLDQVHGTIRPSVHGTAAAVRVVHAVSRRPLLECGTCEVTYTPVLQASATLALSHLRGAAGDVVTVVGTGAWPLLYESYGHHEQLIATVDARDWQGEDNGRSYLPLHLRARGTKK